MGKDCTKPNDNIYFRCRKEASLYDERLRSRESAADLLGVSPSSLADYELGNTKVVPVDKVNLMADLYNAPQLRTAYCKYDCPIGGFLKIATEIMSLDTIVLKLIDDYYSGEFYHDQLRLWIDDNVGLISTLPDELLDEMQNIVEDGFLNGKSNRNIVKSIQERFGVSRSKARFYATDQLSKLNASITQQQQTECGVEEYVWSSSKDQRVRDRHRQLDGTKHRWDDPPIVDYRTGRRAHPGEDYRCRCVALPVFNIENLTLPWEIKIK